VNVAKLKIDMSINDADLSDSMKRQAPLYTHYAMLTAQAQRQMDRAKIQTELTESKVHDRLTRAAKESGEKVVEAAIAKQILRDPEYLKAHIRYADAKMVYTLAKESLEAMKQRRDMLVQIGVAAREEMKGDLRLRAIEENNQSARERALDIVRQKRGATAE
jgi:uncharacterized protein YifN (PemK superfamily)